MIRARSVLLLAGLLLMVAPAALAYVIVFKDGSTLVAKERFEIDGDRALVTLQSGTQTVLPLEDIDLELTEKKNDMELGSALVIDTIDPEEPSSRQQEEPTLADVARGVRREGLGQRRSEPRRLRRTPAGNIDFFALPREPYEPLDRAREIREAFHRAGLTGVTVRRGSSSDRVLVDVVTATRGEVLEALQGSARAFLEVARRHPEIEALELALATPSRSRAGQFVLTPENSEGLAEETVSAEDYFLSNVLF